MASSTQGISKHRCAAEMTGEFSLTAPFSEDDDVVYDAAACAIAIMALYFRQCMQGAGSMETVRV